MNSETILIYTNIISVILNVILGCFLLKDRFNLFNLYSFRPAKNKTIQEIDLMGNQKGPNEKEYQQTSIISKYVEYGIKEDGSKSIVPIKLFRYCIVYEKSKVENKKSKKYKNYIINNHKL